MAKSALHPKCPFCQKDIDEISRTDWGETILIESRCGHTIMRAKLETEEVWPLSRDGRQLFPYQKEGVKFLESANGNALLLDEQGLGKTIQECMFLNRNDVFPALGVVKSGLRAQWFAEIFRWSGKLAQVIDSSREQPAFEYADVVLVSMDSLRLLRPDIRTLTDVEKADLKARGKRIPDLTPVWSDETCAKFKHIFVDEAHLIKNPGSARTQALRKIASSWERVQGGEKPSIICMSGTNIEKHAGEMYVTLNLVAPEKFHNEALYRRQHVEQNKITGKLGGLRNPAYFKSLTEDFIIRRLRKDVLPDLPKIFRQFRLVEMPPGSELDAYKKVVKEFMKFMDEPRVRMPSDILGYLSKMRHLTGIAKTTAAVEYVQEFLLESGDSEYEYINEKDETVRVTAGRKLVLFLHHKMAGDIMMHKISNICKYGDPEPEEGAEILNLWDEPLYLNADVPPMERQKMVDEFKKPGRRIMIASTLAAAEGLNMQFVSDAVMMERQWNPSKEEQAEGRFPRPGALASKINVVYLIAAGTIDDFLTTLVEQKRRNVQQTLDGTEINWDEKTLLSELVDALRTKGLRKWAA